MTITVKDNSASVSLSKLPEGVWYIVVHAENLLQYYQFPIHVVKNTDFKITLSCDEEMNLNSLYSCYGYIPGYAAGNMSIYIDGKLVKKVAVDSTSLSNQQIIMENNQYNVAYIIDTTDLAVGKHTLKYEFKNQDYQTSASKNFKITSGNIYIPDVYVTQLKEKVDFFNHITVDLPNDARGNVSVLLNGKFYKNTTVNGVVPKVYQYIYIDLDDVDLKEYDINVIYSSAGKYPSQPASGRIKVVKPTAPKIVANDLTVAYSSRKYFTATVYDKYSMPVDGATVTFKLNNKVIGKVKTDYSGVAKFKVTQTPVTKAKVTITAMGKTVSKKLTVKHVVILKSVTVKKSAKLTLQATLSKVNGKYLKNKHVTFKFNDKTYKTKTNSKGIAKISIAKSVLSKLKVGKTVTYQATYLKDTVKKTVKVKK